jgi:hypothetical protein
VIDWYATVVIVAALIAAAWSGWYVARDRRPGRPLLVGLAVLEALTLVQLVVGIVLLVTGSRPDQLATFVGYLVAAVLAVPVGAAWALSEKSRSSTAVLVVACLVVPVLVLRLQQVWDGTGA